MAMLRSDIPLLSGQPRRHLTWWWWLLLLFCFGDTTYTRQNQPRLVMRPTNPLVQTGHTLNLTCSIENYLSLNSTRSLNASAIFFKFRDEHIQDDYVTVLNATTAQLRYPYISKNASEVHWFCYLGASDLSGQQVVFVGDPPVKPYNISCRVYNWEKMVCTWLPKNQTVTTGLKTTQKLYWTIQNGPFDCPKLTDTSCTWFRDSTVGVQDSLKLCITYQIIVKASNQLANATTEWIEVITCHHLVQPNKPIGFSVDATSISQHLSTFTWTAPGAFHSDFKYYIEYQSEWRESGATPVNRETSEKSITLKDLTPYTKYNVSIRCRPVYRNQVTGFLSEAASTKIRTLQDVPAVAPTIAPGGFSAFKILVNKRNATIYWNKIPPEQRNGKIKSYRIRAVGLSNHEVTRLVPPSEFMVDNLTLKISESYDVYIDAKTVDYNTSLELVPLFIPKESRLPLKPKRFVSLKVRDSVLLNWTASEGAVGYTAYWCKGIPNVKRCQEEVQWHEFGSNTTNHTLVMKEENIDSFIFAISAQYTQDQKMTKRSIHRPPVLSSGFLWSKCTSDTGKDILAPENLKVSEKEEEGAVTLKWETTDCTRSGYIHEYKVYYCLQGHCDDGEVSVAYVDSFEDSHTIKGLSPTQSYTFWVESTSPYSAQSEPSQPINHKISRRGLAEGYIVLIVIVALVFLVFIAMGVVTTIKKFKKNIDRTIPQIIMPPMEFSNINGEQVDDDLDREDLYLESLQTKDTTVPFLLPSLSSGDQRVQENYRNQYLEYGHAGRQPPVGSITDGQDFGVLHGNISYVQPRMLQQLDPNRLIGHIYQNGDMPSKRNTQIHGTADGSIAAKDSLTPLLGPNGDLNDQAGSSEAHDGVGSPFVPGTMADSTIASYNRVGLAEGAGEQLRPEGGSQQHQQAKGVPHSALAGAPGRSREMSSNGALKNNASPDVPIDPGYSQVTSLPPRYSSGQPVVTANGGNINNANNKKDESPISSYSTVGTYPYQDASQSPTSTEVPVDADYRSPASSKSSIPVAVPSTAPAQSTPPTCPQGLGYVTAPNPVLVNGQHLRSVPNCASTMPPGANSGQPGPMSPGVESKASIGSSQASPSAVYSNPHSLNCLNDYVPSVGSTIPTPPQVPQNSPSAQENTTGSGYVPNDEFKQQDQQNNPGISLSQSNIDPQEASKECGSAARSTDNPTVSKGYITPATAMLMKTPNGTQELSGEKTENLGRPEEHLRGRDSAQPTRASPSNGCLLEHNSSDVGLKPVATGNTPPQIIDTSYVGLNGVLPSGDFNHTEGKDLHDNHVPYIYPSDLPAANGLAPPAAKDYLPVSSGNRDQSNGVSENVDLKNSPVDNDYCHIGKYPLETGQSQLSAQRENYLPSKVYI